MNTLRGTDDPDFDQILSTIRSKASIEDIKASVKEQLRETRLPKSQRMSESGRLQTQADGLLDGPQQDNSVNQDPMRSPISKQRRVMDISSLTSASDPPIIVSAQPWTSVTEDDVLVSNLISLWFTWGQPFYKFIDPGLFLADMQKGDLNCRYCSPFLVNALLAMACPFSDFDEARTKGGVTSDLMVSFREEAVRLLEETNEHSVSVAQGLAIMFTTVGLTGQATDSFRYLQLAASVCDSLQTKYNLTAKSGSTTEATYLQALSTTCWGIFDDITMGCLAFGRLPEMRPPSIPLPQFGQDSHEWAPYPTFGSSKPSHFNELLRKSCSFSIVVRDICILLYDPDRAHNAESDKGILEEKVTQLHTRLKGWYNSLPSHLLPQSGSPPSVLVDA